MDSLGVRSTYIVGLSRGATVALSFAVAYPERVSALVLYGAPPPVGYQPIPSGAKPGTMFGEIARKHGLDSLGKFVLASPVAWIPPNRPDVTAKLQASWSRYTGRDLLDPHPESGRVPAARMEQLSGLRMPTLVVHGDHEIVLFQQVADTLVKRIPTPRKVVITNGGHAAHLAQPEAFDRALAEFFASVASRR